MISSVKCLVASALAISVVNGHGYMSDPKVVFTAQAGDPTQFIATIESSASGLSGSFNTAPADNVASFTKAFGSSKYTSLKELMTDKATVTVAGATLTCGSCDPKQEAQPMPKSIVEWAHSDSEGFTASHEGPCEVWCDDVRTFHDDNCAAHYTTAPAKLPFDRDACMGASSLTFYWMAMHSSTWQVYVNCAPLESTTSSGTKSKYAVGTSSAAASNTTSTVTTDAPSAVTEVPSVTTAAPSTPSATTVPIATSTPETPAAVPSEESDCGSYDIADSDSDCGSFDIAGSESDCDSYDIAGGSADEITQTTGSQKSFNFGAAQGTNNVGTVSPYV